MKDIYLIKNIKFFYANCFIGLVYLLISPLNSIAAEAIDKGQMCRSKAYVYEMAATGRDIGYSPKQALSLVVGAKDEQEWTTKIAGLAKDGVSLSWMKEAINRVYFDSNFADARGNNFYIQMWSLCINPQKQFEPLK